MKKIKQKPPGSTESKRTALISAAIAVLGSDIQLERRARGLTQNELGLLSGTSINFVSQLESGKTTVRIEKILAVLHTLGLELNLARGRALIRGLKT